MVIFAILHYIPVEQMAALWGDDGRKYPERKDDKLKSGIPWFIVTKMISKENSTQFGFNDLAFALSAIQNHVEPTSV